MKKNFFKYLNFIYLLLFLTLLGTSCNQRPSEPFPATAEEIDLLAKLVTAEAGGEPYLGQVAVAAVVLNRMKSPDFPNTINKVIYQPGQFSPAANLETITPSSNAIKATQEALSGNDPSKNAYYFYNPTKTSSIFFETLQPTIKIGQHQFCR